MTTPIHQRQVCCFPDCRQEITGRWHNVDVLYKGALCCKACNARIKQTRAESQKNHVKRTEIQASMDFVSRLCDE